MIPTILNSIYFLFLVPCIFLVVVQNFGISYKVQKRVGFLLMTLMVLIAGLRWETGTDWKSYYLLFDEIDFDNFMSIQHYDLGYKLLNLIVKIISNNYTFFLLFDSALAIYFVLYIIYKNKTNVLIAVLVFYTNYFLAHYLGSNRRIIAIGLGLGMFYCIYKNQYKKSIYLYIMAVLFHRTALVLALAYVIPRRKISNIKCITVIAVFSFFGITDFVLNILGFICTIGDKVTHWYMFTNMKYHLTFAEIEGSGAVHNIFGILKRFIILIIFIFFYKRNKKESKLCDYFFNLYVLSVCMYCTLVNIGTFAIMTTYFTIVEIIMWGFIYKFSNLENRILITCLITVICIIEVLSSFSPRFVQYFFPYRSIFTG